MRKAIHICMAVLACVSRGNAATLVVGLGGGAEYTDIQSAIDAAKDGDTVVVTPGEYVITEPINFNRLHDPDDPASPPVKNIVLRSGGGAEVTTIRMSQAPADPDRAGVVVFLNGEDPRSILRGFTLTGGKGTRLYCCALGGGVACSAASPRIEDCTIQGCTAYYGGGVYCEESCSPAFDRCTITGNIADSSGGGLAFQDFATPLLKGCRISRNVALQLSGGGLYCADSSPVLEDCAIEENTADEGGGGLYSEDTASPRLIGCTISGNAAGGGGGLSCEESSPELSDCAVSGNSAHTGGGAYLETCSASFKNCTFSGNAAAPGCGGAAFFLEHSSDTMINCTITGNGANDGCPGGLGCDEASPTLTNCIVWGNSTPYLCGGLRDCLTAEDPSFVKVGAFDFQRFKTVNVGSLEVRLPDFIVEAPDCHLQSGSPAIDAGTSEGAPTTDIEGHGRPCGNGVDIGAYEFGDCPASGTRFVRGDVDGNGAIEITDPIGVLRYLFLGEAVPTCLDAADADDDGVLDITDAIYSLTFQFLGGPAPKSPYPECGIEPTEESLGCARYDACPSGPEGDLIGSSACKRSPEGGGASAGQECMEYAFTAGVLTLRHVNADLNCCAKAAADISIDGTTITIMEEETYEVGAGPCRCICLFDLDLEIRNLIPGPYLITVFVAEGLRPDSRALEFPVDLAKEPSGSFCEERTGGPWSDG